MIQIESELPYPNYAESCRTQLKLMTSQRLPNCHKQTTSYVYVPNFSEMFCPEESDSHRFKDVPQHSNSAHKNAELECDCCTSWLAQSSCAQNQLRNVLKGEVH